MNNLNYETVVIGAGQAGLAMGFYLKQAGVRFLLIDQSSAVGDVWRKRYDSLTLFTPRMYSSLPGLPLVGEPHGFPMKDEIADYLQRYADVMDLPIQLNTYVQRVTQTDEGFQIETSKGNFLTRSIVVATGPFQTKQIPAFSQALSSNVVQLHSSDYRNPSQLQEGNVLVVGGGNSGAQIAVELAKEKETFLAVGQKLRYFPLTIQDKSIFWWLDQVGILETRNTSFVGKLLQKQGDPIFGKELKHAILDGSILLKDRVTSAEADRVLFRDASSLSVQNIIWATGFRRTYNWLQVDGVFVEQLEIMHERGVSPIPGLYFLGLPWQSRRGSSLLQGVGEDARFLMEQMNMR
ncbi:NAD(P)/FAD-dependent oxidoreductase [Sporosarcina sp. 179-K 3D1 HS]|uniref:flavin-containing monooxygenase n=1 Tax=Sporosarcina sp. 179-K 3D1 HS TaxID=3232169 RepID=UPI0039A1864D